MFARRFFGAVGRAAVSSHNGSNHCGKLLQTLPSTAKLASNSSFIQLAVASQAQFSSFASPSSPFSASPAAGSFQGTLLQRVHKLQSEITQQQKRTIMKVAKSGKFRGSPEIKRRFMRLGNGLWLRKQSGYKKRVFRRIFSPDGLHRMHKKRRNFLLDIKQSKMLDKMVNQNFKKQHW